MKVSTKPEGEALIVLVNQSVRVGTFERDVDGFYYFWPELGRGGFWSETLLREIADALKVVNQAWSDQIDRDLSKST